MANRTEIPDLQGLIKDSIAGEVTEQHVQSLLPPGENYGSVMYKVDFKVKQDDGKQKEYHAVAKCTPLNKVTQEMFNTQATFKSEIGWYTTVIPTYKQFQKDQGVDKEIDFFQKFYGARISLDPESDRVDLDGVILTENLKALGYKNEDRHTGFDLRTTESVLRDVASFHALPLAIKLKNPELYEKNIAPYLCPMNIDENVTKQFKKELITVFEKIPSLQEIRKRICKNINETNPFECTSRGEPWITVIHHDLWVNNIMITSDENPKTIILDLQTPGSGSPAGDVLFLLLTSVQLEVIKDRVDYFLRYYYDQFISNLETLKILIDKFSYEEFLKEINTEAQLSEFSHSIMFTNIMMMEKGQSTFDSSNADYKIEDMTTQAPSFVISDRLIRKFEWISLEAAKRNWI